jgi:hypothetical protein
LTGNDSTLLLNGKTAWLGNQPRFFLPTQLNRCWMFDPSTHPLCPQMTQITQIKTGAVCDVICVNLRDLRETY